MHYCSKKFPISIAIIEVILRTFGLNIFKDTNNSSKSLLPIMMQLQIITFHKICRYF